MTSQLFEAIVRYAQKPTAYNRERGMTLITEGHLDPHEVDRLKWAIKVYDEKVAMTA